MNILENKIELTELANKLFMYTDSKDWRRLIEEVFTQNVLFDMSSAGGGEVQTLKARDICYNWQEGLKDMDAVHHQAGQYIIEITDDAAEIYAYAMATHYKKAALNGCTRVFVGSYNFKAVMSAKGWRLSAFKYNLKFMQGNELMD